MKMFNLLGLQVLVYKQMMGKAGRPYDLFKLSWYFIILGKGVSGYKNRKVRHWAEMGWKEVHDSWAVREDSHLERVPTVLGKPCYTCGQKGLSPLRYIPIHWLGSVLFS